MKNREPNPLWKPGDSVASPVGEMKTLELSQLSTTEIYKLLIGSIVPRPIALVSSQSAQGEVNLAPFSFFTGVSSHPPCLVISFTRKNDLNKKDTLRNIESTGEFVVNTVSEWMAEPMNFASAEYPYGVDEMKKVGFTPIPSLRVKCPRVKESPIHMECRLEKKLEIGEGQVGSSTLVIGRIEMIHVMDEALENGKIKWETILPLARMGGLNYGCTREVFELPRPKI